MAATESDFADIVGDVAASQYRVDHVSTLRFSVTVTFRSRSGRSTWESHMSFDPGSDWHYSYTNPYPGGTPWSFGNEVQRRLRALD